MSTRTLPEPQKGPRFKASIKSLQVRMEVAREREEYDRVTTMAAAGLCLILEKSQPQPDQRGNLRFMVTYQIFTPMTEQEMEEQKEVQQASVQQAVNAAGFSMQNMRMPGMAIAGVPETRPLTLRGLTKEEREMSKEYKEPADERPQKKGKKGKSRNGAGAG